MSAIKIKVDPIGEVTFLKIDNKKLSMVYRTMISFLTGAKLSVDSDISSLLEKLSSKEFDFIRDTFFEYMICEGYGQNLLKGYDILCETHTVFAEMPLVVEAFKVYLLEQFKLAMKDGGALASLKSRLAGIQMPSMMG